MAPRSVFDKSRRLLRDFDEAKALAYRGDLGDIWMAMTERADGRGDELVDEARVDLGLERLVD